MDAEGALMLRTADGNLQRITGGDVTLEKTPAQFP
jgi:biotin-(acetyl-CoA carboxylase) ligase